MITSKDLAIALYKIKLLLAKYMATQYYLEHNDANKGLRICERFAKS